MLRHQCLSPTMPFIWITSVSKGMVFTSQGVTTSWCSSCTGPIFSGKTLGRQGHDSRVIPDDQCLAALQLTKRAEGMESRDTKQVIAVNCSIEPNMLRAPQDLTRMLNT